VIVQDQKWGTIRVGMSRRRMEAEIRKTRKELGALAIVTLIVGGLAAALFARRIGDPVRQLEARAAAIARGDLSQRIEPRSFDEIGRLATAFNHMAAQLRQQRRWWRSTPSCIAGWRSWRTSGATRTASSTR
jgi:two-component system sensor histidine kinase VicK